VLRWAGQRGAVVIEDDYDAAGVGIDAVGSYRITNPGPGGLIFGYATASEQAIAEV
jgi:hypothetical protein